MPDPRLSEAIQDYLNETDDEGSRPPSPTPHTHADARLSEAIQDYLKEIYYEGGTPPSSTPQTYA